MRQFKAVFKSAGAVHVLFMWGKCYAEVARNIVRDYCGATIVEIKEV